MGVGCSARGRFYTCFLPVLIVPQIPRKVKIFRFILIAHGDVNSRRARFAFCRQKGERGTMARRREYIRGIQLDALTLRLVDELANQRGQSRSQVIRDLIRQAAADNAQERLPGFGDE